jgi:predicted GIY-YIG superfamily endonuclease
VRRRTESAYGSFYTGFTDNLNRRFLEHKNGKGGHYTSSHKPIKIIFTEKLLSKSEALKRESQIKGWSRRKKINILNLKI